MQAIAKLVLVGLGSLGLVALLTGKGSSSDSDFWGEETKPENTEKTATPLLKRGERFIDPETGEELQVRAVGGRPRKKSKETDSVD